MFNWLTQWLFRTTPATNTAKAASSSARFASLSYQGYDIHPEPLAEGGQYRINGRISQVIAGTEHNYTLVRADLLPSPEQAAELMIAKAKRVIDEHGSRLFH